MNAWTVVLFASLVVVARSKPVIVGSSGVVSAAGAVGPSGVVNGHGAVGPVGANPGLIGVGVGLGGAGIGLGGAGIGLGGAGIGLGGVGIGLGARIGGWDDGQWHGEGLLASRDWANRGVGIVGGHGLGLGLSRRW